jgi:hypothetical protein
VRIEKTESFELWDEDIYPAKVVDVIEESAEGSRYGKPRLRWVLLAHDANRPEGENTQRVSYWTGCTLSTHEKATLRPLVEILRPDLDLDDPDIDLDIGHPEGVARDAPDPMIGARCRVLLGLSPDGKWNRVKSVMAAETRRSRPAPQRQPVAAAAGADEGDAGF